MFSLALLSFLYVTTMKSSIVFLLIFIFALPVIFGFRQPVGYLCEQRARLLPLYARCSFPLWPLRSVTGKALTLKRAMVFSAVKLFRYSTIIAGPRTLSARYRPRWQPSQRPWLGDACRRKDATFALVSACA